MASSCPLIAGREVRPLAGAMAFYLCKRERANTVRDRPPPHLTSKFDKENQRYFLRLRHSSLFVDMILGTFCSFLPTPLSRSSRRRSSSSAGLSRSLGGLSSSPGLSCSSGRVASSPARPSYHAARPSSQPRFSNPTSGLSRPRPSSSAHPHKLLLTTPT
jgi:hypothetical protein